jgi:hypothetical protein
MVAGVRVAGVVALATLLELSGCTRGGGTPRGAPPSRCELLQQKYGLSPCPADPLPVETVTVQNLDPRLPDAQAHRIAEAYLRSRALYYLAIQDNSDRFFGSGAIDVPDATPLMFDAETGHIRDARAKHGSLVLASRSTLKSLRVVPLPADLGDDLDLTPAPMADAVVIEAVGPERQVIRVPGQADQLVSTLDSGDSYQLLVGGILVTREGLPETFAELGQWECLDPDTHGACLLSPN